jgi:DNA-binding LacI/PurR family transcriptional regulator
MPRKPKHFANKKVTLYDIAKSAGVSPMTVSLAMRDQPEVREKTKLHVQSVAREMGYRPQSAASVLAGGKTHAVGLVFA